MSPTTHMLDAGAGYWQTDRYPIGGEFHRTSVSIPVTLTGRVCEFGQFKGFVEFTCEAGENGKPFRGYTRAGLIKSV